MTTHLSRFLIALGWIWYHITDYSMYDIISVKAKQNYLITKFDINFTKIPRNFILLLKFLLKSQKQESRFFIVSLFEELFFSSRLLGEKKYFWNSWENFSLVSAISKRDREKFLRECPAVAFPGQKSVGRNSPSHEIFNNFHDQYDEGLRKRCPKFLVV